MPDRLHRFLIAGVAATLAAVACQATNPLTNDLGGVVVTLVDSGGSLNSARSFALPDTIVTLPQSSEGSVSHDADREITASIRRHLLALGWQDVSAHPSMHPDVVILVAASERIEVGVAYYDWYGSWGYLPYWNVGVNSSWGWGMPTGAIPYAYQAGTVLVTMLDLRAQRAEDRTIPLLWAAALDGIVTSPDNTASRVMTGVNQAFAQSPYLRIP